MVVGVAGEERPEQAGERDQGEHDEAGDGGAVAAEPGAGILPERAAGPERDGQGLRHRSWRLNRSLTRGSSSA